MPAHTQVLDPDTAVLAPPEPAGFAAGMLRLANDPGLREQLGRRGRDLTEKKYCFDVFKTSIIDLYSCLEAEACNSKLRSDRSKPGA
jgi:glycosyltransferase involved in cell wall biosynthesis